jgi:hypothetical protein
MKWKGSGMPNMEDGIVCAEHAWEKGRRLVVVERPDGFFHYREEWIEPDDGDKNGPYQNFREYPSLFGTVDDAVKEAATHISWMKQDV